MRILFKNIKTIVNILKPDSNKLRFDEGDCIEITKCGLGSSLAILVTDGMITDFGEEILMTRRSSFDEIMDCSSGCIIPGFVDGHTHPVWAGDRVHEFVLKLRGASYMEIHEAGGGIQYTVEQTAAATEETLYASLMSRLKRMMRKGTTTVECKTGYGLHWDTEEKLLKVLNRAKTELPIDISITFLSAHSVPRDMNAVDFTKHVVDDQIPRLKCLRQTLSIDNIDVFCETGVFNIQQSEKILTAGKDIGLRLNFHADELSSLGGAELAGRLKAHAASHLEEASPAGVAAMAASGTAAVLLPTTALLLRLRPPPARAMIEAGVPVALGTDFNPNAYCLSMPTVMFLACTIMNLSPDEALAGATINAAYSLGMSDKIGAITPGRQADFLVLDCDRWENIIYQLGEEESLITLVVKKGQVVYSRENGFVGF